MKQFLLIVSIFVFEGVALWGIGEKTSLRTHYDRFMHYPVNEKSASVKTTSNKLAINLQGKILKAGSVSH